jgi:rubredoxin
MRIVESVCGNCGAKDTLFPVPEEGTRRWRCENCGHVFEEENENENVR